VWGGGGSFRKKWAGGKGRGKKRAKGVNFLNQKTPPPPNPEPYGLVSLPTLHKQRNGLAKTNLIYMHT